MAITEGTQPAPVQWTGAWTTAQATAAFTPEAGALLVALVAGDGIASGAPTTAAISDSVNGTTGWVLLYRSNTSIDSVVGGTAEVWCKDSPGVSMTVSATGSGVPAAGGQLAVRTLLGAKAAASQNGAANGASASADASQVVQVSVAAGTGGRVYGAAFNYTSSTVMTFLANTVTVSQFSDTTNGDTWEAFKSAADTAGPATYGYSTVVNGMIAAAEILAGGASPDAPRGQAAGTAPAPQVITGTDAGAPGAAATGAAPTATALTGQATSPLYAGSATGVSGSWADTSNAVGSGTGTYATWTDEAPASSATLELATFGAQAAVPGGSTVNSVTCTIRHAETPAARIASVTAQAYLAGTPYGTPQALTVSATDRDDTVTFAGLTWADLADLRVRVTVTRT